MTGLSEAELVVRLSELSELETVEMVPELSERWCAGILGDLRPVGVGPSGLQVGECDGYCAESVSVRRRSAVQGCSCERSRGRCQSGCGAGHDTLRFEEEMCANGW